MTGVRVGLAAALVVIGCRGSEPDARTVNQPGGAVLADGAAAGPVPARYSASGVATAIEASPPPLRQATETTATLELEGCRRTWPGRVTFDLRYRGPDQGRALDLKLGEWWGDVGASYQVRVSVSGPGELSVTVPLGEVVAHNGSMSLRAPNALETRCSAAWDDESINGDGLHPPVDDLQPPDLTTYPAGDARAVLATATTEEITRRPALALLAGTADPPFMDGLWLLPGELPIGIEVVDAGPCRWVMVAYNDLMVLQGRGCGDATQLAERAARHKTGYSVAEADTFISLPCGPWTAAAAGPTQARANLAWHTLGRSPALTGDDPGYDPTAELTAFYAAHPELSELGRLDFQGGFITVAVAASGPDLLLAEHPRLETPRPWPGDAALTGAATITCKTAVAYAKTTATTGFAYITADSPATQAQINRAGTWESLPITTTGARIFAGTVLNPGEWTTPLFRLLDPTGTPVRCTSVARAGTAADTLIDGTDPPQPPPKGN